MNNSAGGFVAVIRVDDGERTGRGGDKVMSEGAAAGFECEEHHADPVAPIHRPSQPRSIRPFMPVMKPLADRPAGVTRARPPAGGIFVTGPRLVQLLADNAGFEAASALNVPRGVFVKTNWERLAGTPGIYLICEVARRGLPC